MICPLIDLATRVPCHRSAGKSGRVKLVKMFGSVYLRVRMCQAHYLEMVKAEKPNPDKCPTCGFLRTTGPGDDRCDCETKGKA